MSIKVYEPQLLSDERTPPPRPRDVFDALLDDSCYWTVSDWLKLKNQIDRHIRDMGHGDS